MVPSTSLNVPGSSPTGIAVTTTSRLFSSAATASIEASSNGNGGVLQPTSSSSAASTTKFQRHPNDDNLFLIPPELHPIYRPLPLLMRLSVWLAATAAAAGWTCLREQSCSSWTGIIVNINSNKTRFIVGCLLRTVLMGLLASTLLQERLRPPTRITTFDLKKRYTLPSVLSRFESIPVPLLRSTTPRSASSVADDSTSDQSTTTPTEELGVHYLQYDRETSSSSANNSKPQPPPQFQAIYANHGFGASSLSWLPVLPRMVDRLRARVGVGHDAVGFGFTDRPKGNIPWKSTKIMTSRDHNNNSADTGETETIEPTLSQRLAPYSTQASSTIGTSLLQHVLLQSSVDRNAEITTSDKGGDEEDQEKPVILMGHSMGALATLKMALAMPPTTRKWIILVAPALGVRSSTGGGSGSSSESDSSRSLTGRIKEVCIHGASMIGRYILRRVVG